MTAGSAHAGCPYLLYWRPCAPPSCTPSASRSGLEQVPEPELPPDGALVEVRATGLCRSDWHGWMGHDDSIALPHVPGHEFAGVVAAVGPEVRGIRPGRPRDRAVLLRLRRLRAVPAGPHPDLRARLPARLHAAGARSPSACSSRSPTSTACRCPTSWRFEAAAALGCRFMTAFAAVGERGGVRAGDWLAVHGCGGVGLSAVMLGRALGARVDRRRRRARAAGARRASSAPSRPRRGRRGRGGRHPRADRRRRARLDRRDRQRRHRRRLGALPAQPRPPRPGRPAGGRRARAARCRWPS